ncbi:hypothetical protein GCM10025858_39070 [Alicyclobacillus sacchari]|nr:hypothetical protein GCM10025858_37630 [Alicyclobacillus sacchari]GMA59404.1 hypothetical protein GCM10025858_39070 [Alicyclobacillus sacchari]
MYYHEFVAMFVVLVVFDDRDVEFVLVVTVLFPVAFAVVVAFDVPDVLLVDEDVVPVVLFVPVVPEVEVELVVPADALIIVVT